MDVQVSNLKKYEGAFRVCATSGVLSGIAAATATAGHLFVMRWNPPVSPSTTRYLKWCAIQRIRAKLITIHGPTAAQEIGIDVSVLRGFSANYSGGTALTFGAHDQQKRTGTAPAAGINGGGMQPSQMADMRIASTSALTAGTQTFDAQPIAQDSVSEAASAATVLTGRAVAEFVNQDDPGFPIVLAPNEGICVRNTILQGAGYTGRLMVEVDWFELNYFR